MKNNLKTALLSGLLIFGLSGPVGVTADYGTCMDACVRDCLKYGEHRPTELDALFSLADREFELAEFKKIKEAVPELPDSFAEQIARWRMENQSEEYLAAFERWCVRDCNTPCQRE